MVQPGCVDEFMEGLVHGVHLGRGQFVGIWKRMLGAMELRRGTWEERG